MHETILCNEEFPCVPCNSHTVLFLVYIVTLQITLLLPSDKLFWKLIERRVCVCVCVCESRSVMSDSLQPHGLYSPWNSLGQNTGVGSLSLPS